MKSWISALSAMALLCVVAGCPEETKPGGPGVIPNAADQTDATFTLTLPSASVEQGKQVEEVVGIERGDKFSEVVTVKLLPPAGVTVQPAEFKFEGEKMEQKVTIGADAIATAGDHKIGVTGTPATGAEVKDDIAVTVTAGEAPAVVTPPQDDAIEKEPLPPSDLPTTDPLGVEPAPQP